MKIVKRSGGAVVSTMLATAGKIMAAPVAPAKVAAASNAKGKGKSAIPQAPKDATPGAKLAFKLHHAIALTDVTERNEHCYKLGKLANEIGPGDPDVAAAFEKARADQRTFSREVDSTAEGTDDAFYSWSAAFIAGYTAKAPAKGTPTVKRYLLTVEIGAITPHEGKRLDSVPPESHTGKFDSFGDAFRAAIRWYTVKSDVAHLMSVRIDTIDLTVPPVPGEPPAVIASLAYPVSLAEARQHAQAAQRRQDRGPTMYAPKAKGGLRLSLPTCHETRVTFSRG